MNKKQLVAKISTTLGQSKADAERTFDSITTIILNELKNDETEHPQRKCQLNKKKPPLSNPPLWKLNPNRLREQLINKRHNLNPSQSNKSNKKKKEKVSRCKLRTPLMNSNNNTTQTNNKWTWMDTWKDTWKANKWKETWKVWKVNNRWREIWNK
jgi:hypothetical protein